MLFLLVALALGLHVGFWGAGLAALVMPRGWRRFWPVLVFPAGFALQSAVVWFAAVSGAPGANTYAWAALVLPAGLLLAALRQRGGRRLREEAGRFGGVAAVSAVSLLLLVLPLAVGLRGLTTVSLGSCDAADYAAGARMLMEFSRGDQTGFMGLTEVVRVHSVDNFFEFWLRLNHFTPAALIALNGRVVDCAPHQLTTLMTMVLVAGTVPLVFWIARAVTGIGAGGALVVAQLYGVSPLTWYAVAQVAPGQLLAAQGIVLITWAGFTAWRARRRGAGWSFAAMLVIGYWLALGSYNFIVLVFLVPAIAYAGGRTLVSGEWRAFGRWLMVMLAPLAASAVVFFERTAGLAERFTLLRTYNYGWPIPALSPEGWLGFVDDAVQLTGMAVFWRVALPLVFVGAVIVAVRRRRELCWRVTALVLPVLAGYAYLQWRAVALGTNASYDGYKLLAVFFPGILAASLVWLRWQGARSARRRITGAVLIVFVGLAHLRSVSQFHRAMQSPPLRVTSGLRDLQRVETMPEVASVNLLIPDMWSRLWANAFLLRKPQYFATHTYEARANTALKGEWDLLGGIVAVVLPAGGSRAVNAYYTLVHSTEPNFIRAELGGGWHPEEFAPDTGERWCWSQQNPELKITNPQAHAVCVDLVLDAQSAAVHDVSAVAGGRRTAPVQIGRERVVAHLGPLDLPPGESVITLSAPQPLVQVPGDPRPLGWSARRIEVRVRASPTR